MTSKQRERILITSAAVALVLLAGDRLILTPLQNYWSEKAERIDALRRSVAQGQALLQREKAIRERWEAAGEAFLPEDRAAAEEGVFKSVSRWIEAGDLIVTSMKPRWIDEEHYSKFELRATGRGDLESVARFLYELETDPTALRLESIEIASRDDGGEDLSLSVRFSAVQFKGGRE